MLYSRYIISLTEACLRWILAHYIWFIYNNCWVLLIYLKYMTYTCLVCVYASEPTSFEVWTVWYINREQKRKVETTKLTYRPTSSISLQWQVHFSWTSTFLLDSTRVFPLLISSVVSLVMNLYSKHLTLHLFSFQVLMPSRSCLVYLTSPRLIYSVTFFNIISVLVGQIWNYPAWFIRLILLLMICPFNISYLSFKTTLFCVDVICWKYN